MSGVPPKEETPAPESDVAKPADAFDKFVGDFAGVRRLAIAFWNVMTFGFLVLLGGFIVLLMGAVVQDNSDTQSANADTGPNQETRSLDLSQFGQQLLGLIMTVILTGRSLGSC
jgi:hypothetical protein